MRHVLDTLYKNVLFYFVCKETFRYILILGQLNYKQHTFVLSKKVLSSVLSKHIARPKIEY